MLTKAILNIITMESLPAASIELKPLTRRDVYNLMIELESQDPHSPDADLEDVTDLVFSALDCLSDCDFLAKPNFDLNETMSAFEAMDPKMDMRLKRNEVKHPVKLIKEGTLVVDRELNPKELAALLDEFFVQIATWQGQTAQLQQTVYSCQYLTRREYYEKHNPLLIPYIEAFHYIVFTFYQAARNSLTMRDEDISFPPSIQPDHKQSLKQIYTALQENLEKLSTAATTKEIVQIAAHMKMMNALLLIVENVIQRETVQREILNELEEKIKVAKKKGKGKGKKEVKISEEEKWVQASSFPSLIRQLKEAIGQIGLGEQGTDLHKWAASLFGEEIIAALPMTNAKKKFTKLSFPESISLFTKIVSQLEYLDQSIVSSTTYFEEFIHKLQHLSSQRPCSLVHFLSERSIITEQKDGESFLFPMGQKSLPVDDFMTKGVREIYPFVTKYKDTAEFQEFFHRYSLVVRELVYKALRNQSRQRRAIPKYYEDFKILFNDANAYDNMILSRTGQQPREGNTVALTMAINLVLNSSLELFNRGFELDLYGMHEHAMVYSQLKYLYQLLVMNRKSMILGMCGDEAGSKGYINLEDLQQSSEAFKQRRRKFSLVQKLICDEYELYKALFRIVSGMEHLFFFFEREGIIVNIIDKQGVEKQVYDNRFGVLAELPFPKYKDYDEFVHERGGNLQDQDPLKIQEQAKTALTEGKNMLARLIQTEDEMRCNTLLPKASLEQLQRIAVMNSLSMTKASMFGKEASARVNREGSVYWLPLIEVEKRVAAKK
ncbi:hypothetical protein FGO68_gene7836 [Halteria grandinella]|uniref:Uncharacterized protein n=1 Tax=Halteria grandinella TaxID=5974 RepID=A0A8J8T554_HALGN|nr:hypothetical protein FGO68_gene7836 [Halteria grandinella]